jgi:ABC-type xylose transport system permease subunit
MTTHATQQVLTPPPPSQTEKESRAQAALRDIALQIADQIASGLETRPTHLLVLQKLIDPIVRHILSTIFPWVVGVAICFLILLVCTVVTCFIVLRTPAATRI